LVIAIRRHAPQKTKEDVPVSGRGRTDRMGGGSVDRGPSAGRGARRLADSLPGLLRTWGWAQQDRRRKKFRGERVEAGGRLFGPGCRRAWGISPPWSAGTLFPAPRRHHWLATAHKPGRRASRGGAASSSRLPSIRDSFAAGAVPRLDGAHVQGRHDPRQCRLTKVDARAGKNTRFGHV